MTPEDVLVADHAGTLAEIACSTTTLVAWSRETFTPDHAEAALDCPASAPMRQNWVVEERRMSGSS
jgi:hypothetical protein